MECSSVDMSTGRSFCLERKDFHCRFFLFDGRGEHKVGRKLRSFLVYGESSVDGSVRRRLSGRFLFGKA